MNHVPDDDELPQDLSDAEPDVQSLDDAKELAEYDDQLRQGTLSGRAINVNRQSLTNTSPVELIDFLHVIEKVWPRASSLPLEPVLPQQIGRFQVERVLGHGGFGIVYLARDPALQRRVALKVPRLHSFACEKLRDRFRREARAAATLDHPNIVPIHEAGEDGPVCYIASAYCEGPNLADWIKSQKVPVPPRLAASLVAQLADATHYSHSQGVLHRDIKPANILLSSQSAEGSSVAAVGLSLVPRLTDFGLAKLLEDQSEATAATTTLGTPAYMAPEQCGASPEPVGPQTDVYALGTVLYELLTGRAPFQGTNVADLFDQVRFSDVVLPRRLRPEVPRDLEVICEKCLEKKPSRRYGTCAELADDLRRFVDGRPIRARRHGLVYSTSKWIKRRPALAAVCTISILMTLLLSLGGWYHNRRLAKELEVSQQLRTNSLERERHLQRQMYAADLRIAWQAWVAGDRAGVRERLARHHPSSQADDMRGFEWHFLKSRCELPPVRVLRGHQAPILTVDVSADDRYIASGDRGGTVKIWDLATGQELKSLQSNEREITTARFSPDLQTLATCGSDRTIRLWDTSQWIERACLRGHKLTVASLCWSPGSKQLATGGRDNRVIIWDAVNARRVRELPQQADVVRSVAWSDDGRWLATAVRDQVINVWDTKTWKVKRSLTGPGRTGVLALAFAPTDSERFVSGGYHGHAWLMFNSVTDQAALVERKGEFHLLSLDFSRDGTLLLCGRSDGKLQLSETLTSEGVLSEHSIKVAGQNGVHAAISSDGRTIVAAVEEEHVMQLHSVGDLGGCRPYRLDSTFRDIGPALDRTLVIEPTGTMCVMPFPPRSQSGPLLRCGEGIRDAVFLPLGTSIVASSGDGRVRLYDSRTGDELQQFEPPNEVVKSLAVSATGEFIAGSGESGAVVVWNARRGAIAHRFHGHQKATVRIAFSHDDKLLATGSSNEQHVGFYAVSTGAKLADLPTGQDVMGLAFSPDDGTLAVATYEDGVQLWNVATRQQSAVMRGHAGAVRAVAYSLDGRSIVTAGDDGTARLWHTATYQELMVLARRSVPLQWCKFLSPRELVIRSSNYKSGTQNASDVLFFEAPTLAASSVP